MVKRTRRIAAWAFNTVCFLVLNSLITGFILKGMHLTNNSSNTEQAGAAIVSFLMASFATSFIYSIIQIIVFVTTKSSLGGLVAGYRYELLDEDSEWGFEYYLRLIAVTQGVAFLQGLTCGIFWLVDVITLNNENKQGMYWEKWARVKKVASR